ncbi:MAG: 5-formyltetrahydrofolate cyclo-ligase [Bacilli bacterium]|nr:5-formyltetrahydrofolate cyclo-ligase [Bacilli bacterium]
MNKKEIRNAYLEIRNNITDILEKSKAITKKVLQTDSYQKAKVIGIYKSFSKEVDTSFLIEESLKEKIVCVPIIQNKEMKFYQIEKDTKYIRNNFGIEEPIHTKEITDIDLLIVPGICFDKELNRIGFGGGYYDKYLSKSNVDTIAICFEEQIYPNNLPIEPNDVKVKQIITNKSTYR